MKSRVDTSHIPQAMNIKMPRGGVIPPMSKLMTATTPKWMGSMPTEVMSGIRIGIRIIRIAVVSSSVNAT